MVALRAEDVRGCRIEVLTHNVAVEVCSTVRSTQQYTSFVRSTGGVMCVRSDSVAFWLACLALLRNVLVTAACKGFVFMF